MKTYMLLAVAGLSLAACGGQSENAAGNQTADASGGEPTMMAGAASADGVVRGGAIDVLQREGWRVDPRVQQADAAQAAPAPASAG